MQFETSLDDSDAQIEEQMQTDQNEAYFVHLFGVEHNQTDPFSFSFFIVYLYPIKLLCYIFGRMYCPVLRIHQ